MARPTRIVCDLADADGEVCPAGDAMRIGADGRPLLIGGCCRRCATRTFPGYPVCPACMSEEVVEEALPRRGVVYSFSIVHVGPQTWKKPFAVGYVDLENAVRVFAPLRGPATAIGAEVELDSDIVGYRPDGTPVTRFVFRAKEA